MDTQFQPSNYGLPSNNLAARNRTLTIGLFVLGFVVLVLGITTTIALVTAGGATADANKKAQTAAASARADQKKADELAARQAQESPYRTYQAAEEYGAFSLKIPKNWSAYVQYNLNGRTQLDLSLQPDIISITGNAITPLAAHLELDQSTFADYMSQYKNDSSVHQSDITVSGIKSKNLTGSFKDITVARVVVVPVRDKVMVFTNQDKTYDPEFTKILEQAKINP
jgi:type II secretory pathway pseudopilin PulG